MFKEHCQLLTLCCEVYEQKVSRAVGLRTSVSAPSFVMRDHAALFDDLTSGLDALYVTVDDILAPFQPIPPSFTVQPVGVGKRPRCGAFVELLESHVLPFGICSVEQALWRTVLGQSPRTYPNFVRDVRPIRSIVDFTAMANT